MVDSTLHLPLNLTLLGSGNLSAYVRPMTTPRELLLDAELNNFSLDFGIHSKESKPLGDFNRQPRQKKSKSTISKLKDKTLRRLSRKKVEAVE